MSESNTPEQTTPIERLMSAIDDALKQWPNKPNDAEIFPSVCLPLGDWRVIRGKLFGKPVDAK